jgi:uncharacterized membrane protein YjjP (DUF1212 family)
LGIEVHNTIEAQEIQLIRSAAELLFTNGQSTKKLIHDLRMLMSKMGYECKIIPQWSGLIIEMEGVEKSQSNHVNIINSHPSGVQMNKVKLGTLVIHQFVAGSINLERAIDEIHKVDQSAPCSLMRFISMSAIGAAALGVIFGIMDTQILSLVMLSAGIGALLRRLVAKVSINYYSQVLVASIFTGVFGSIIHAYQLAPASAFIFLCPCMILVPGPHLLNGVFDIARGDIGIGQSRLAYATTIVLVICVGLVGSLVVHHQTLTQYVAVGQVPFLYLLGAVCAVVAAYGSFFSMTWRDLLLPILIGVTAFLFRYFFESQDGISVVTGVFIASLVAGVMASLLAAKTQLPFAALAFAAVVAMIPGSYLFRMAYYLFNFYQLDLGSAAQEGLMALNQGITAALIVIAISLGVVLPKLCIDHFLDKRLP